MNAVPNEFSNSSQRIPQTVPIAEEWSGRTSEGDREGEENGRLQRRLLAMVFFAACFVLCSTTTEFAGHV